MMPVRGFAGFVGALYLILGLAGFVPPVWDRPLEGAPPLRIDVFHATLLGAVTVNIVLSALHLALGFWGCLAAARRDAARRFALGAAPVFLALGVAGLIPIQAVSTLHGTAPVHGWNAWAYLATGLTALVFAFARSRPAPGRRTARAARAVRRRPPAQRS